MEGIIGRRYVISNGNKYELIEGDCDECDLLTGDECDYGDHCSKNLRFKLITEPKQNCNHNDIQNRTCSHCGKEWD